MSYSGTMVRKYTVVWSMILGIEDLHSYVVQMVMAIILAFAIIVGYCGYAFRTT